MFVKQRRASQQRKERQHQEQQRKFRQEMEKRQNVIGSMPRTIFDFKLGGLHGEKTQPVLSPAAVD